MKIGAIVQARTSSTRLPRKILMDLPYNSGITVLQNVLRRLKRSKFIEEIVVATTTDVPDQEIIEVAKGESVRFFRGNKEDVLERYYFAAKEYGFDIIVRITSDCPCIDPMVIDDVIRKHLNTGSDYTSNTLLRTYPDGLDVEVFNFDTLHDAYKNAKSKSEREHVTSYIHTTAKESFKTCNVVSSEFDAPDIRITLDTIEDYVLLCTIFDYLYPENEFFSSKDVINLFNKKPWLKLINAKIIQKNSFKTFEEEKKEAIKVLKMQDLNRIANYLEDINNSNKYQVS
ncbi:MAG: spore coat polysaccharide biosynthesis protein SpsF [Methanobacterium sp.]|uniref:glycosyltransferase family protein n=1 Tax=Methanobacterium sp. TaxID=2164 RepID=UPI0024AB3FF0|nr:glycosyltransferase family protein [Methanobacterium sp.]MDI3549606.1 spore coat polysaccharide biosynthesis protein SpsF [Methanobacterium sp.]